MAAALPVDIGLTAEQRGTIERIVAGAAFKPFASADPGARPISAAIRAGKVDEAALRPRPEVLAAFLEHRTAMVQALEALHATLTAEQRSALVAAGFARASSRAAEPSQRPPGDGRPFGSFLRDLDLSKEQEEAFKARLQRTAPNEHAVQSTFDAAMKDLAAKTRSFEGADFDASAALALPPDVERLDAYSRAHAANVLNGSSAYSTRASARSWRRRSNVRRCRRPRRLAPDRTRFRLVVAPPEWGDDALLGRRS